METVTVTQQPLLLDKAFFGKDNCLTVQFRKGICFLNWGRKQAGKWDWKNVKMSDAELGSILRVLRGQDEQASFYHEFNGERTQIWVSRQDQAVVMKAADHTKGLQPGEQEVLAVLLEHGIWLMNMP